MLKDLQEEKASKKETDQPLVSQTYLPHAGWSGTRSFLNNKLYRLMERTEGASHFS